MLLSDICLSDICLSHTSGLSREQRPRKTKIGTGVVTSQVTRTPLSRSKGQRSSSPGRFTHRGLNASGSYSGKCGNVLGVGNYCHVASARRRARRWGAHGVMRRAGSYRVATRTACIIYVINKF